MKREYIQENWVSYRKTLPPGASEAQLVDTRIAFFAGALALMSTVMSNLDEDREPTDEDIQMLDDLNDELTQFNADMERRANGMSLN